MFASRAFLVVFLAACSDSSAASDASDDHYGVKTFDSSTSDAAADAIEEPVVPPPAIPSCVGDVRPLVVNGMRSYASVDMSAPDAGDAGLVGDFLLDFGANGSTIDLGAFKPPPVPSYCNGDASLPGAACSFPNFDFFGPWGTVQLVTADYSFLVSKVRQAGIIGTDFLSVFPFTIDYTGAKVYRALSTFCADTQLLGAGFQPVPSDGFYTNDAKKLRPLSDVITSGDASTSGFTVPNVPTVAIRVGGVSALAQLDTGYDDRLVQHSINVNSAMLQDLQTKFGAHLSRQTQSDLYLTTCVEGVSQLGMAWTFDADTEVDFLTQGGTTARHDTTITIFAKDYLPAAAGCGGIETWTVPAAQLGASFLVSAQAVIFDPLTSRVWLPGN
jgi:hypothetical protein